MTLSDSQERIFNNIEKDGPISQWQNWRWQVRNSVNDVKTFEELLGVELGEKVRNDFLNTVEKFPMSVTPYYLSLIDTDNVQNRSGFYAIFSIAIGAHYIKT